MPTVYVELEILCGIPKLVICAMPLLEHNFLVNSSVHPYQLSSHPQHTRYVPVLMRFRDLLSLRLQLMCNMTHKRKSSYRSWADPL